MASGAVPLAMFRGVNPVHVLPKIAARSRGDWQGAVQGQLLELSGRDVRALRPDSSDDHPLESWGDAESVRGSISLQQPAMDRVFKTRATADVLIGVTKGDPATASRYPVADYRNWLIGGSGRCRIVRHGARPRPGFGLALQSTAAPRTAPTAPTAAPLEGQQGDMYLVVYPSPVLGDGRGG
jgi:molybdopterin-containing oxidoreductase family iron-sulfur binding subunit